jgi:hypothetical protein
MMIPRDIEMAQRRQESLERKQQTLAGEQPSSNTANVVLGGAAGAGLGVLGGLGLVSGVIPNLDTLMSLGITLPLMLGTFMAGAGAIVGSFVDLLPGATRK